MIISIVLIAVGVLMFVYRERMGRALQASSRGFSRELGGPFAWWNDPPEDSRRAHFQDGFNRVFIVLFALTWIGFGIYGFVHAASN